jgi:hypothetical protein
MRPGYSHLSRNHAHELGLNSAEPGSKIPHGVGACGGELDPVAEGSEFSDHLACPTLCRRVADGQPTFLIPNALMKNLPNQTTEPVGACANGLGVSEAQYQTIKDTALRRCIHSPLSSVFGYLGLSFSHPHVGLDV